MPATCQPCWNSLPRTSWLRAISLINAASLAWMGLDMVDGAANAFQISRSNPRIPASLRLGMSGARGLRPADVTPMARSLPARTCACASAGGISAICS
ncbi:hypothetical protein D3C71_2027670 [compost metagenome]